jgi:hypothetical protein
MQKQKPTDIVAKIVEMLTPFSSDDRHRIIRAALTLIGENPVSAAQEHHEDSGAGGETDKLPPRARTWVKQNEIRLEDLEQVFHFGEGNVEVVASEIPGKNNKEKTHNAYVLVGIAKLLATGDPSFDDKSARALCKSSGCYSDTNHATYLKNKGNRITGTKDQGWTLTAPGLKHGAALVKELSNAN